MYAFSSISIVIEQLKMEQICGENLVFVQNSRVWPYVSSSGNIAFLVLPLKPLANWSQLHLKSFEWHEGHCQTRPAGFSIFWEHWIIGFTTTKIPESGMEEQLWEWFCTGCSHRLQWGSQHNLGPYRAWCGMESHARSEKTDVESENQ